YKIDFNEFFALELHELQQQAEDGLIELHESGLEVTPAGRLLLRAVAMAFDQYLPWDVRSGQFSRVI
nr:coproporphyrinogen III oxidase [Desulfuromonadales bacterium]NIS39619.1 coproporphyrinogen III oxidase [Desulfuromonadales bacterium]